MGSKTTIAWTDHTFNPQRGCTKVSAGCARCYMFTEQRRYGLDPTIVVKTKTWGQPRKWQRDAEKAGRQDLVFVCSWSDLFHVDGDPWRPDVWKVMAECPNLIFQVLTKRPERIADCLPADWGDGYANVWLGASTENQTMLEERLPGLLDAPAVLHFISAEPLLGPLDFRWWHTTHNWHHCLTGEFGMGRFAGEGNRDYAGKKLGWVIVGAESGPKRRPMELGWLASIAEQCKAANVPIFIKQDGAAKAGQQGRISDELWARKEFPWSVASR